MQFANIRQFVAIVTKNCEISDLSLRVTKIIYLIRNALQQEEFNQGFSNSFRILITKARQKKNTE